MKNQILICCTIIIETVFFFIRHCMFLQMKAVTYLLSFCGMWWCHQKVDEKVEEGRCSYIPRNQPSTTNIMKNEIVYWGQNFIPQLSQWIKDTDDNNEKDIEMFMSKFDQLVERYPFLKSEKEESIHIWLVIYKMTEIEGWKFF